MTEYFLVNNQDYFAAGYIVSHDQVYVDTTAGLGTAVAFKAADAASAKAALYQQVQSRAAANSQRVALTDAERDRVIQKLDAQFKLVSTDDLQSC
jgi:hypothetical protein